MKTTAAAMVMVFFLTGCYGSMPLYYHERSDGTRYYQTVTEQIVVVDKDGWVVEAPVMYGGAYRTKLQKKGDDWDLRGYDVVEPPGHCQELLRRYPESCFNRIWEPVALILMAPVLLIPGMPLLRPAVPAKYGSETVPGG